MRPLGTSAPDFALPDPDGTTVTRDQATGNAGLLVMFICNHCPFVKLIRHELAAIGTSYQPKGLGVVAISANDAKNYPDDAPDKMKIEAADAGYTFPYLYDESQDIAKAYHAVCTPDFFLYNAEGALAYRGQLDDARPGNGKPVTGADLRAAIDAVIDGRPAPDEQRPSIGCNIKWIPGNEPA